MNYVLKPEGATIYVSAHAFRAWAEEYYDCAVNFVTKRNWSPVPYALLCKALELKLKSYHLENCTQDDVKKFGHDLVKCLKALPSGTVVLSKAELNLLGVTNRIYNDDKGFDYVSIKDLCTATERFSDLEAVRELTRKILDA